MDMTTTEVTVKGVRYYVPTDMLNAALATFDQNYRPGCDVPALALAVARDFGTWDDPFSVNRLRSIILSIKSRKSNKKQARARRVAKAAPKQQEMWT